MASVSQRLVFNPSDVDSSANVGSFIRMDENGKLVTYSNSTEAGSASFDFVDGDVTVGTDSIAETAHGLETGSIIQLSTSGALPAGLSAATDYYVIRVDADNFKLAASLADAEAGSAVDITAAAGGGTHSLLEQARQHSAMDVYVVNDVNVSATDLDIRDLDASTDSVESWTHDGSGTAITSTGTALDVNIASGAISVDFTYDYAEDSAHSSGDVGAYVLAVRQDTLAASVDADGDYASFKVDAKGALYVKDEDVLAELAGGISVDDGGGSLTVDAVDLDIRDLTQTDEITVFQGTDPWIIGDGGGSITVDATDLDIRDLSAAQDSIASWTHDGSGNAIGSTAGSLDVNVTNDIDIDDDLADTAILGSATAVSTSAVAIVASALAARKWMFLANEGNKSLYYGQSGVTTSNGFPLHPGMQSVLRLGPSVAAQIIGEAGSSSEDLRVLELS